MTASVEHASTAVTDNVSINLTETRAVPAKNVTQVVAWTLAKAAKVVLRASVKMTTTNAPVHVISAQAETAMIYAKIKPAVPTICLVLIVAIQHIVRSATGAPAKPATTTRASSAVMEPATIGQHTDVVTV